MMQTIIVILVLAACLVWVVRQLLYTVRHAGDPCRGCKLGEVCKKRRQNRCGCK